MKSNVAVTLIICGTLLVLNPFIYTALLFLKEGRTYGTLVGAVDFLIYFGWKIGILAGFLMILTGFIAGIKRSTKSNIDIK